MYQVGEWVILKDRELEARVNHVFNGNYYVTIPMLRGEVKVGENQILRRSDRDGIETR